jgi:hypothetical protein
MNINIQKLKLSFEKRITLKSWAHALFGVLKSALKGEVTFQTKPIVLNFFLSYNLITLDTK